MSTLRNLVSSYLILACLLEFSVLKINTDNSATDNETSTTESLQSSADQLKARLQQLEYDFKRDEEELENSRKKLREEKTVSRIFDQVDGIRLNVGGEIIETTCQTLTSFSKGLSAVVFSGQWEGNLQRDENEVIFFDFNPIVFRHLLDQLQLSPLKTLSSPPDPSLAQSFQKMVKKLQLQDFFPSENNILTINIDG